MIGRWTRSVFSRKTDPDTSPLSEWDVISAQMQAERSARKAAIEPHRNVATIISAILLRHDPIGINFETNTDEYDAEAESIVLRLATAPAVDSAESVETIVHQEFVRWFSSDLAGSRDRYRSVAEEIWEVWSGRDGYTSDTPT